MVHFVEVVAVAVTTLNIAGHAYGQVGPDPSDISRPEGATDVSIHCPFSAVADSAPIWRINSTLYEPLSLKYPLMPTIDGINIKLVDRSLNNTTFQCFLPTGDGLKVSSSSIGTLTVTKNDSYQPPKERQGNNVMIILDHQRFSFDPLNLTIAWKLEENNMSCTPPVNFTIQLSNCTNDGIIKSWYTTKMVYSFKKSSLLITDNKPAYFTIVANSSNKVICARLPFHFQLNSNVSSLEYHNDKMGEDCVDVPKIPSMQSLYIVGLGKTHELEDCICPLCNDGNCVPKNCKCYPTSAPKLISDSTNATSRYSFCWLKSDLVTVSHAAKLQLYYFIETKNCANNASKTAMPFLGRRYTGYVVITVNNTAPVFSLIWKIILSIIAALILFTIIAVIMILAICKCKRYVLIKGGQNNNARNTRGSTTNDDCDTECSDIDADTHICLSQDLVMEEATEDLNQVMEEATEGLSQDLVMEEATEGIRSDTMHDSLNVIEIEQKLNKHLGLSDHYEIMRYLKDIPNEDLIMLGGALGLSNSWLKRQESNVLLNNMVEAWLLCKDDVVEKSGYPTYNTLVKVLQDNGHRGVAMEVEKQNKTHQFAD